MSFSDFSSFLRKHALAKADFKRDRASGENYREARLIVEEPGEN
ncbi:MAG: hypothetical protein OXJ52_09060 [Oligoflexia bacterium]|nr:hypothetical protein [Oligoflexia bacterium]